MRTRIDKSARTYLAICGCGWRGATTTLESVARRQSINHELTAHPGDHHARNAAQAAARRRGVLSP